MGDMLIVFICESFQTKHISLLLHGQGSIFKLQKRDQIRVYIVVLNHSLSLPPVNLIMITDFVENIQLGPWDQKVLNIARRNSIRAKGFELQ